MIREVEGARRSGGRETMTGIHCVREEFIFTQKGKKEKFLVNVFQYDVIHSFICYLFIWSWDF